MERCDGRYRVQHLHSRSRDASRWGAVRGAGKGGKRVGAAAAASASASAAWDLPRRVLTQLDHPRLRWEDRLPLHVRAFAGDRVMRMALPTLLVRVVEVVVVVTWYLAAQPSLARRSTQLSWGGCN